VNKTFNQIYDLINTSYESYMHNMFGDKIVCIEEISLLTLYKRSLYNVTWLEKILVCLGYETSTFNIRLQKVLATLQKAIVNSSFHSVYVVKYGNGVCIVTRRVPSLVPPPRSEEVGNLMMVLVNGTIDTTPFYRQTQGSINLNLGLLPREYAVLALICMGERNIYKLLNLLVRQDTSVTTIDSATFDEKIYKDGDIVIL